MENTLTLENTWMVIGLFVKDKMTHSELLKELNNIVNGRCKFLINDFAEEVKEKAEVFINFEHLIEKAELDKTSIDSIRDEFLTKNEL